MRRVIVLGAGGIIGQHLRLQQPADVEVVYTRRTDATLFYTPLDLRSPDDLPRLNALVGNKWGGKVDVVINLAGESRTDVVEASPKEHRWANVFLPQMLGVWCDQRDALLLHISTQGIFSGRKAPYTAVMPRALLDEPVNEYGRQKLEAEQWIERTCHNWMILRLTFALGIRPFPTVGRKNPLEAMFEAWAEEKSQQQVDDRFFSPCVAEDAAQAIWKTVKYPLTRFVEHIGTPIRTSRYQLAVLARQGVPVGHVQEVHAVQHREAFPDLADRPYDTTYEGSWHRTQLTPAYFLHAFEQWRRRLGWDSLDDRGDELAAYFGTPAPDARAKLGLGFGALHGKVAEDWRAADPKTDEQILQWYRDTPAYCWELSAYHIDPGFNYIGMCTGIAQHLKTAGARRVLCLGDGIGDLTAVLGEHGLDPIYHDLGGSLTAQFAAFRFQRRGATPWMLLTSGWAPLEGVSYDALYPKADAVIAHDFFEHLTNVAEWARACYALLAPGGLFLAQNAFAIGDPDHGGSIPMHLSRNNKYADDDGSGRAGWDTLLDEIGFERTGQGNWRRKPA